MSNDYASAVAAGINFLDENGPKDWRSEINLDSLRLDSCEVCVLGQVFGTYDDGLNTLGIDTYDAKDYGFTTNNSWTELTQAWKDALGKNNTLVEAGDIYSDTEAGNCCTVQVVGTKSVEIMPGKTEMVYLARRGSLSSDGSKFTPGSNKKVLALFKPDFEPGGQFEHKVELTKPLALTRGMFVTNDAGEVFYVINTYWAREVKDGASAIALENVRGMKGLREVKTATGKKFSETVNN